MDSLDKDRAVGGWSYLDLPDPAKGQEGYPRLLIENRAYASRVFRKLHMELAHRQDGMQVSACRRRHALHNAALGWRSSALRIHVAQPQVIRPCRADT